MPSEATSRVLNFPSVAGTVSEVTTKDGSADLFANTRPVFRSFMDRLIKSPPFQRKVLSINELERRRVSDSKVARQP